jgi:hypothetical protein
MQRYDEIRLKRAGCHMVETPMRNEEVNLFSEAQATQTTCKPGTGYWSTGRNRMNNDDGIE